jgi:membrane protein DedA with SNARE-associated domain
MLDVPAYPFCSLPCAPLSSEISTEEGGLEAFIATYGYVAIFILTFFEGESVLIAAGFLAFNGYLTQSW